MDTDLPDIDLIKTGRNIRLLMEQTNITAQQLADQMGYTKGAIYAWIRGKAMFDLSALVRMSTIFNVPLEDIIAVKHSDRASTKYQPLPNNTTATLLARFTVRALYSNDTMFQELIGYTGLIEYVRYPYGEQFLFFKNDPFDFEEQGVFRSGEVQSFHYDSRTAVFTCAQDERYAFDIQVSLPINEIAMILIKSDHLFDFPP